MNDVLLQHGIGAIGGITINGIIDQYLISENSDNISAGDFIEWVNNIKSSKLSAIFKTTNSSSISAVTLTTDKVLVTFKDGGNSYYGTAVVLSVSGTTISVGAPIVFKTSTSNSISTVSLSSDKVLVTFSDNGNSNYGTAVVLSVSGTTISVGTPIVFKTSASTNISTVSLSSDKVLVTFRDDGNSYYGTAVVLSVSGATISVGAPIVFKTSTSSYISTVSLSSDKVLITFSDNGNSSYGTAVVLSVSGTTISVGTPIVFKTTNSNTISTVSLSSDKVLVTFSDGGNSYYGTAVVLSVSGTTISVGTPIVFKTSASTNISTVSLSSDKVLVTFRDDGNSYYGTAVVLSVSGATISVGAPIVFKTANSNSISTISLSSDKVLVTFSDGGNSNYGTAVVLSVSGTTTSVDVKTTIRKASEYRSNTPVVFKPTFDSFISTVSLSSDKVLVTFRDGGNSNYGTAVVLSVSGTTISVGDPIVFKTANSSSISTVSLSSDKVLVTFKDNGNSYYGTAVVLSVSGTTISVGAPIVFKTAYINGISTVSLSSDKVLVTFNDGDNSGYGTAVVLSVSGTTISVGAPIVFKMTGSDYISTVSLSSSKVLVTFRDEGNRYYGTAVVLSVSGTTISVGAPTVFKRTNSSSMSTVSLSSDKALITFSDNGNSSYGTAVVLSVSGTTISVGTPIVFKTSASTNISTISLSSDKVLVTFRDGGNSGYGTAVVLSVSGTTISVGAPTVFKRTNSFSMSTVSLSSDKVLVTFSDNGNSGYGTAVVLSVSGYSSGIALKSGIAGQVIQANCIY